MPSTYSELTSRRVLPVSWLDGEKLSQSKADDVGDLVNIGVICYLKQLLDTGFFHADPHPGNLIRTPDGRLAILDFGLVSVVLSQGRLECVCVCVGERGRGEGGAGQGRRRGWAICYIGVICYLKQLLDTGWGGG